MTKEVTVRSLTVHLKLLPCLDSVLYSFYFVTASSAYNNIIIVIAELALRQTAWVSVQLLALSRSNFLAHTHRSRGLAIKSAVMVFHQYNRHRPKHKLHNIPTFCCLFRLYCYIMQFVKFDSGVNRKTLPILVNLN